MAKKPTETEKRHLDVIELLTNLTTNAHKSNAGLVAIGIPTALFIAQQPHTDEDTRTLLTGLVSKTREGPGPWNAVITLSVEKAEFIVQQMKLLDTQGTGKKP